MKRYQLRQYYEDAAMEPIESKWGHLRDDTVYVTEADHLVALSAAPAREDGVAFAGVEVKATPMVPKGYVWIHPDTLAGLPGKDSLTALAAPAPAPAVPFVPYSTDEKGRPHMELDEHGRGRLLCIQPSTVTQGITVHGDPAPACKTFFLGSCKGHEQTDGQIRFTDPCPDCAKGERP